MERLRSDIAFALRLMRKRPAFTALIVATLAIGIGANTAIFTLADATLLRPLPYAHAEELDVVSLSMPPQGEQPAVNDMPWSYPKFTAFREIDRAYASIAGMLNMNLTLTGDGAPERIGAEAVTENYFETLGVTPRLGRFFSPGEAYAPGAAPYAVIGEGLWQTRFGAQPGAVGSTVVLDGVTLTVVGVAPSGFRGLNGEADVWVPIAMLPTLIYPGMLDEDGNHWLRAVGRRKPGASSEAIAAQVAQAGSAIAKQFVGGTDWSAVNVPVRSARQDPVVRRSVFVLLGAVTAVLLIACVNVANLLLARATQREREVAVRRALGATRNRLLAQLLTESVVLSMAGLVGGLVLALWGIDLLATLSPERTEALGIQGGGTLELQDLGLNLRVLGYAGLVTLLTAALFGLAPAVQLVRSQATVLREAAHGKPPRGALRWLHGGRGALVITEIALALVLLTGATLMLRSFSKLRAVELGFDPRNVLTFAIEPPVAAYPGDQPRLLQERITARIAQLPGVVAVGADRCAPLVSCMISVVTKAGERTWDLSVGSIGDAPRIGLHAATPDYFDALRIPLRRGRVFGPQDREGTPRVVVINEGAAERLFPGQDPIGQRVSVATSYFEGGAADAEVIGVVADVKYSAPDQEGDPLQLYAPALQWSTRTATFMVRTAGAPEALIPALRDAVLAEAPDLPMYDVKTMEELSEEATARSRFATLLLGVFALASLVLAAVGIYGVMSFAVAQRTRELGLRMALGARATTLLRLVLAQGATLLLLGTLLGLVGALLTTRVLGSLLFGVQPTDLATFSIGVATLAVVALAAVLIPAVRAMRNDPMAALRYE